MSRDIVDRSKRLLIAMDFDGTMAPIVPRPELAEILPEFGNVLSRLAGIPGVVLAVVSGRDVVDLHPKLANLPPVWIAGGHGRSILEPEERPSEAPPDPRLDEFRRSPVPGGVRREIKSYSVAFHWRGRVEGEPTGWLRDLERKARDAGLDVLDGRKVIEILLPGSGKDRALARLLELTGADAVVYAGDDRTDLEAIRWAQARGVGIFVSSGERAWIPPPGVLVLDGPEQLVQWLTDLVNQRESALPVGA